MRISTATLSIATALALAAGCSSTGLVVARADVDAARDVRADDSPSDVTSIEPSVDVVTDPPPPLPSAVRLIAPISTSTVTSRRPLLRWSLAPGANAARITLCRDRACAHTLATFDAAGTSSVVDVELPRGVVFWSAQGLAHGRPIEARSATWEFFVGATSAPVNTATGTTLDVNGDGFADVAVGDAETANGTVFVYLGGAAGIATMPSARLTTTSDAGNWFGRVTNAGDTNGDGFSDLVVMTSTVANRSNRALVYLGGPSGVRPVPAVALEGASRGFARAGCAGDVNGDGFADVFVVSDGDADFPDRTAPSFDIHLGSSDGPSAQPSVIEGVARADFDEPIAGALDFDGDGFSDVLGHRFIFLGGAFGVTTMRRTSNLSAVASGSIGDVNGDGYSDIATAVQVVSPLYESLFTIQVVTGGPTGFADVPLSTSSPVLGPQFEQPNRFVFESLGDLDGDGFGDFAFAPEHYLYVFHGGAAGASDPPARLERPDVGQLYFSLIGNRDVDGDTFTDLVIGDSSGDGGRVRIYRGTGSGFDDAPAWILMNPGVDSRIFGRFIAMNTPLAETVSRRWL